MSPFLSLPAQVRSAAKCADRMRRQSIAAADETQQRLTSRKGKPHRSRVTTEAIQSDIKDVLTVWPKLGSAEIHARLRGWTLEQIKAVLGRMKKSGVVVMTGPHLNCKYSLVEKS